MQNHSFEIKCVNGHQVHRFCANEDCQRASGICSEQNCPYFNAHFICNTERSTQEVINTMLKEAKQSSDKLDDIILGNINKMTKILEITKQQYLNFMDKDVMTKIQGNGRKLYNTIVTKKAELVKPIYISKLFTQQQQNKVLVNLQSIATEIQQKMTTLFQNLTKTYRCYFQQQTPLSFVFSSQLSNSNKVTISQNKKSFIQTENSTEKQFLSVFITPSVSQSNNIPIKLKVLNKIDQVYIGVRKRRPPRQFHMINNQGYVLNKSNSRQNHKTFHFNFRQGAVIVMRYHRKTKQLIIDNQNNYERIILSNIDNEDEDLYYCINGFAKGEQWQILDN